MAKRRLPGHVVDCKRCVLQAMYNVGHEFLSDESWGRNNNENCPERRIINKLMCFGGCKFSGGFSGMMSGGPLS